MHKILRLHAINDKLNTITLDYGDDDDEQRRSGFPVKTAAVAGAALGGTYLRGRIAHHVPGLASNPNFRATMRAGGSALLGDAKSIGKNLLGKFGKFATAAALSSRHEKLIELKTKIDGVIELQDDDGKEHPVGKVIRKGLTAGGAVAGGYYGGKLAAPIIQRKGSAGAGAYLRGLARADASGAGAWQGLKRAVKGGLKAARYA